MKEALETLMTSLAAPEVTPAEASPHFHLRSIAESAFRDRKDQDLERLQGEIDALTAKAVAANFDPFRDAAESLLKVLRLAFGQVARFVEGDFREQASFYLGQLHAVAEIAERVRQRRLPKEAVELVTRNEPAERVLRAVVDRGSIGASDLAKEVGMKDSNLSTLCKELTSRELLRSDRFGKRVRYSPTPLSHAVVGHMGVPTPALKAASAAAGAGAAPDWPKVAASAAAASLDPGNVLACTSDFAGGIFTLGALRGAHAVVIEPFGDQVLIESKNSDKKLRLPKSIARSISEQMNAVIVHSGVNPLSGDEVFDWCGQRMRAKAEPTRTGKRYRVEFLDPPNVIEEKVHTAFQEIEDEKNRLEEFQKFYARQVLYTYDGEYAPAAKTLGIKTPELKSMLK
jgi:hypothetical protein